MYPNIFFDPDYIEVKDSGDIWLSKTPNEAGSKSFHSAFPRLCTWAKVLIKNKNKDFIFINTHLDHILSETRQSQIKVLIEELNKINHDALPIIICGDFNESPTGLVRKELMDSWTQIYDPWEKLNKKDISTFHKFKGFLDLNKEGARIDWFLIDKSFICSNIEADQTHQEKVYPSDHFPIKLTFDC